MSVSYKSHTLYACTLSVLFLNYVLDDIDSPIPERYLKKVTLYLIKCAVRHIVIVMMRGNGTIFKRYIIIYCWYLQHTDLAVYVVSFSDLHCESLNFLIPFDSLHPLWQVPLLLFQAFELLCTLLYMSTAVAEYHYYNLKKMHIKHKIQADQFNQLPHQITLTGQLIVVNKHGQKVTADMKRKKAYCQIPGKVANTVADLNIQQERDILELPQPKVPKDNVENMSSSGYLDFKSKLNSLQIQKTMHSQILDTTIHTLSINHYALHTTH